MASDGFFQGYMTQSVANANQEVRRANIKIAELRDLRRQDAEELAEANRKLEAAYAEIRRASEIIKDIHDTEDKLRQEEMREVMRLERIADYYSEALKEAGVEHNLPPHLESQETFQAWMDEE